VTPAAGGVGVLLALAGLTALAQPAPLAELDAAGRALAGRGCTRPVESKVSVAAGGEEMQSIDCRTFRVARVVVREGGAAREAPMALVVLGEVDGLPPGLAVGADAAAVERRLGAPARRAGSSLGYLLDPARPGGDSITFEVEAGRVRAISWSWQVD